MLEHLESCADCRRELRQTSEAWNLMTQHVPSLALAEYAHGLPVSDFDRGRVEEHLAVCPSCRQEVELMTSDNVVDFQPRRERHTSTPQRTPTPQRASGLRVSALRRLAIAASLATLLVSSGFLWSVARSPSAVPAEGEALVPPAMYEAQHQAAEADLTGILVDSFESGGFGGWTDSRHEATPPESSTSPQNNG